MTATSTPMKSSRVNYILSHQGSEIPKTRDLTVLRKDYIYVCTLMVRQTIFVNLITTNSDDYLKEFWSCLLNCLV